MEAAKWPLILRERLGENGTAAFAEVLQARETTMLTVVADRCEKRLVEECGKLRGEMQQLRADLRGEMQQLRAELRGEMQQLRGDMQQFRAEVREDMQHLRTDFKIEIAHTRVDLVKWSFLFWVGQVAAVTGLVTLLR
jgi:chromosome segregation ATPase